MLRHLLTLAAAATLLAPLAATADTTPAPPPAPSAVPTVPPVPAAPKKHDHLGGTITAVDATAKTITLTHRKKNTVIPVANDVKIYKADDAKHAPTGTWADLTVGTVVSAKVGDDLAAPVATEIHIHAPKPAK